MTPPHIVVTTNLGWCAVCAASWAPDMIAVRMRPDMGLVCGPCIKAMATIVDAEQARRDGDRIAQRTT